MQYLFIFCLYATLMTATELIRSTPTQTNISLSISIDDANKISEKIWKNECAGSIDGLTTWKNGESFASLGIGHFIWYPTDKCECFHETFPSLLKFLESEGARPPIWLTAAQGCPWKTREEFYESFQNEELKSLRQFLFETRALQAIFIANRLKETLPELIEKVSTNERKKISRHFFQLYHDANGLYALIDYLNFKGAGTSPAESYNGKGWGLLQVLQAMPDDSTNPLADFVQSAKDALTQRVKNSPPERNEQQWLKGWFNRIDTYEAH